MAHPMLDGLIKCYSDQELKESSEKYGIDSKKLACEKLAEDVINEIVIEKKEEYRKEVKKEMEEELEKNKINQLKVFISESIILAFLVGFIVNQGTDLITQLKENEVFVVYYFIITVGIIIVLLIAIYFILKLRYIDEIMRFFEKNE